MKRHLLNFTMPLVAPLACSSQTTWMTTREPDLNIQTDTPTDIVSPLTQTPLTPPPASTTLAGCPIFPEDNFWNASAVGASGGIDQHCVGLLYYSSSD